MVVEVVKLAATVVRQRADVATQVEMGAVVVLVVVFWIHSSIVILMDGNAATCLRSATAHTSATSSRTESSAPSTMIRPPQSHDGKGGRVVA